MTITDGQHGGTPAWFQAVSNPRSVALLGASDNPQRVAGRVQHFLAKWGYDGSIYPVTSRRDTVQGRPAIAVLADIAEPIDVAFVMLRAEEVPGAIRDCVSARVRTVVIGSSGFAESGAEGAALERSLSEAIEGSDTRIIGPNCNGVVSIRSRFTASFMTGLDTDRHGLSDDGVAVVAQSGAIGAFIFSIGQGSGLGIGTFIATGNETDVGFEEVIAALVRDPGTRVIVGYIEGLRDASQFVTAARAAAAAGKPIVILKAGSTDVGSRAVVSHTGSLAGADRVYDGVFAQLGIYRAASLAQLVDVTRIYALHGQTIGSRLSIVTISGGAGILAADRATAAGLQVPAWSEEWARRVGGFLPSFAATKNPIDSSSIQSDPDALENVIWVADQHPDSDVTLLIMGNAELFEEPVAARLLALRPQLSAPLVVVWIGGAGHALRRLNEGGIACFDDPTRCIDALAAAVIRDRPSGAEPPAALAVPSPATDDAVTHIAGRAVLDEVRAKALLSSFGLSVVKETVIRCSAEAAAAVEIVGLPAVAKLRSDGLAHKADVGAVLTGLSTTEAVRAATEHLLELAARLGLEEPDIVIAEHLDIAFELIIGSSVDPTFGPVVTVGIGGILAEAVDDVAVLLPSFSEHELDRALRSLRHAKLLRGVRGLPKVDAARLAPALRAVAAAASAPNLSISSIDVNPLAVLRDGRLVAADALVQRFE